MTQEIHKCSVCEAYVHKTLFMHGLGTCRDCFDMAKERAGIDDSYLFALSKVLKGEWASMTGHPEYGKSGQKLWTPPSRRRKNARFSR